MIKTEAIAIIEGEIIEMVLKEQLNKSTSILIPDSCLLILLNKGVACGPGFPLILRRH